jgi:hypothetical protein
VGRIQRAPKEYSKSMEDDFRRDLSIQVDAIDSKINSILSGRNSNISKMASRASLLSTPAGVDGYPSSEPQSGSVTPVLSYGSFNKGWGIGAGPSNENITLSTMYWFAVPTVWTNNLSLNMSELSGATGRFMPGAGVVPTGGSRKFLINWSMNLWYYAATAYLGLAGRITKTPSGSAKVEVPGSSQTTSWDHYLVYLGSYFYMKSLSGSAMVSLASGDTIQFEFGFNSVSGSGTVSVIPYRTYESGLTLDITAVD